MIKICHMTSAHRAIDTRIFYKECVSLSKEGFEVYLVATGDSYEKDGVNIEGVGKAPKSRLNRMFITTNKVYKTALALHCEIYHLHDPELLPFALCLKKKGKKVIFDSHENVYKQILRKNWIPSLFRSLVANCYRAFEKYVTKQIDGIIITTPSQISSFKKNQKNLQVVTNYPIISEEDLQRNLTYFAKKDEHQICFAGGISSQWNHISVAKSLANLPRLKYCFAGSSHDDYLVKLLNTPAWNKQICYLGIIDIKDVENLYKNSLCGIALLDYDTQFGKEGTLGNTKLFECMKYGRPIICSDLILWKEIIDKYDCGITVNPTSQQEIIDALNYLIDNPEHTQQMGINGHKAFMEEFNWDTQIPKLLQIYSEIS